MKRCLLLGTMLLLWPIAAAAHQAALPVSAALSSVLVHEALADKENQTFLTGKMVRGQPLNIRVEVLHYSPEKQHDYEQYVQRLYNTWFNSTAQLIEQSGRTEEFDDLLSLLHQPVAIRFLTQQEADWADVRFVFESPKEAKQDCNIHSRVKRAACVLVEQTPLLAYMPDDIDFRREKIDALLLHEVGHTLGLPDQRLIVGYTTFPSQPIIGHSSDADVNYAGEEVKGSVMDGLGSNLYVTGITPDDADAIILAVDLFLHNYNRGGEVGWKSLDPKSDLYYVHGKIGNSPHSFMLIEDEERTESYDAQGKHIRTRVESFGKVSFVRYDEKGQPTVTELPFAPTGLEVFAEPEAIEVLASDVLGRPIVEEGPDGETIYTAYFYETMDKLVVNKYNQVLRYETTRFESAKSKKVASKKVRANEYGEFIRLDGYFSHTARKEAIYRSKYYDLSCTGRDCAPSKYVAADKRAEMGLLYRKLKSWFDGRGTAQRVECDSLECQRAILNRIGKRIEELKRNL